MGSITSIARFTQKDFKSIAKKSGVSQFITIPYSHYVELGRWSMQIKGFNFVEHGYAPGQHVLPVIATRLGYGKHLSSTSYVERVRVNSSQRSISCEKEEKKAMQARSTAVPLLVLPSQEVLTDSWSIAIKAGGFDPLPEDVKDFYDKELGPAARQWAYFHILKPENKKYLDILCTTNTGWLWPIIWWFVSSKIFKLLCKIFQPANVEAAGENKQRLNEIISKLDDKIKHKKGKYINGDSITLEDIALCSLGAVLVMPPEYAKGLYNTGFDLMAESDKDFTKERDVIRSTVTGQYILDFYTENRNRVVL